jgi:hypothetical protein
MEEKLEEMLEEWHSYYDDRGDRVFYDYGVRELLKWHATQMYSEEEVLTILKSHKEFIVKELKGLSSFKNENEWFEQFKKKPNV